MSFEILDNLRVFLSVFLLGTGDIYFNSVYNKIFLFLKIIIQNNSTSFPFNFNLDFDTLQD